MTSKELDFISLFGLTKVRSHRINASSCFHGANVWCFFVCVGVTLLRLHELMGQLSLLTEQILPPPTHFSHPLVICTHAGPREPGKCQKLPAVTSWLFQVQSFISNVKKKETRMVSGMIFTNHSVFSWIWQHVQACKHTFTLIFSDKTGLNVPSGESFQGISLH